jgi:hypothetical protein
MTIKPQLETIKFRICTDHSHLLSNHKATSNYNECVTILAVDVPF